MRRILALAGKEVLHIARDARSLAVALLMPLVMVLLFGFALDMKLKDLPVAVLDRDGGPQARTLVESLTAGGWVGIAARLDDRSQVEEGFLQGRFRAAVVIPRGFGETAAAGGPARVQLLVDGADGTTAATAQRYLLGTLARHSRAVARGRGATADPPVDARLRILYNPELISAHFIVPGLVAVVLTMICALLTSIALTREKETGTLEQVLTTPVAPFQVIVGKLLPYMVLGAVDAALVLGVGRLVFGVPMRGSWAVLAGYSFLFILIALSLGLLVSAVARTQRVAMMVALVATYLPSLLLSGFIFELAGMPLPLRALGEIIPATHYIRIMHGIMLKGEGWFPLDGGILVLTAVVLLAASIRRFQETLD
jgi:ABC-2 type transport system permease protein